MKKQTDPKKRPAWRVVLCLLMGGIVISTALLGSSLGKSAQTDIHTIALLPPPQAVQADNRDAATAAAAKEQTDQPQGPAVSGPTVATAAEQGQTASGPTVSAAAGQGQLNQPEPQTVAVQTVATDVKQVQANGLQKGVQVYDNSKKTWSTETQVDLFRDSYGDSVQSADKQKVIAPGTSNFYDFTVDNNSKMSLQYKIALEVKTEPDGAIPLEWRLVAGDGTAGNWQSYGQKSELLKGKKLSAGQQDQYKIEWRWQFEQGRDGDDTALGDQAVKTPLSATATIYVYAEEDTSGDGSGQPVDPDDPNKPDDPVDPDDPNNPNNPNDPNDPANTGDKPQPGDPGYTPGTGDKPQPGDPGYVPGTGDEPQPGDPRYTPGTGDKPQPGDPGYVAGGQADGSQPGADGSPQTGDRAKPLLYLGLLAVAAFGLLVVVVLPARRKKDEGRQHEQA